MEIDLAMKLVREAGIEHALIYSEQWHASTAALRRLIESVESHTIKMMEMRNDYARATQGKI